MRHKAQIRWALVHVRGHINHGFMAFCRKDVIKMVLDEHRKFSTAKFNGAGLTDAQFWRQIKRRRGYCVRRISMRVLS